VFKKIEIWIVGVILLFSIILLILVSGVLRDAYLNNNKTPEFLRNSFVKIAEIPKNIYHVVRHLSGENINAIAKLQKHKDKKRYKQFIKNKRNAFLILPRYDHSLNRSVVEVVDLNNFKIIHTYMHDIDKMNNQVKNTKKFPRIKIDDAEIRFEYVHPLILSDGSLISDSGYSPSFKIDFCSNLKWINEEAIFHHSKTIDHEGNIWIAGIIDPKSKYVEKFEIKDFFDDSIIKLNTDGEILFSKSVLEILIENEILPNNFALNTSLLNSLDPVHLNYIEPAFNDTEYWKQGDVFLSIRNQSAIIHYRPIGNQIINYLTGPFAHQHDLQIISDKEISIFNNNNFFTNNKYSEIIIYNFETKSYRKLFNDQITKENFKTLDQGLSHILKDGSLLVEEQNHGRIILFNNKGEKEWEFVNKDKNGDIGYIWWSRVIEDESFIKNFKSMIKNKQCLN